MSLHRAIYVHCWGKLIAVWFADSSLIFIGLLGGVEACVLDSDIATSKKNKHIIIYTYAV